MISISKSVRVTQSQDGGVLLDVVQGAVFSLNVVGARIVELLQQEQTPSFIVAHISGEFGTSEESVRKDVTDFLELLEKQGLLEIQGIRP